MRSYQMILSLVALLLATPIFAAEADPAVRYANANKAGEIGYKQGWFGEGDTRLHYVEAGKGPLILFYHGFPSSWFAWFDQMEALKGEYRVVAVDGLGAGLSAKPQALEPYHVEQLAKQLDQLARHLNGNKRFILVGHDWGAALSLAYAQGYPKRLNAVIGLSAPPYNLFLDLVKGDAAQQVRSQYMQRFRGLTLDNIRAGNLGGQIAKSAYASLTAANMISADEEALFVQTLSDPETMNAAMHWYRANIPPFADIDDSIRWPRHNRPIKVPTLLLWGEKDDVFVPAMFDKMPQYARELTVVKLPGVGHWASMDSPQLANRAIADFLRCKVRKQLC
jgi:epoxide hydrolase 4